jgi:hypothetical protein
MGTREPEQSDRAAGQGDLSPVCLDPIAPGRTTCPAWRGAGRVWHGCARLHATARRSHSSLSVQHGERPPASLVLRKPCCGNCWTSPSMRRRRDLGNLGRGHDKSWPARRAVCALRAPLPGFPSELRLDWPATERCFGMSRWFGMEPLMDLSLAEPWRAVQLNGERIGQPKHDRDDCSLWAIQASPLPRPLTGKVDATKGARN